MVALMAGAGPSGGALRGRVALRLLAAVTAAMIVGYKLGRKSRCTPEDGAERAASAQLW
jgi:hypothetical protein